MAAAQLKMAPISQDKLLEKVNGLLGKERNGTPSIANLITESQRQRLEGFSKELLLPSRSQGRLKEIKAMVNGIVESSKKELPPQKPKNEIFGEIDRLEREAKLQQ